MTEQLFKYFSTITPGGGAGVLMPLATTDAG